MVWAAGLMAAALSAAAQPAAAPGAAIPGAAIPGAAMILPALTEVRLEIAEAVSSRSAAQGQPFRLRLAAPVVIAGVQLLPAGVPGSGRVVHVAKAGAAGRAGELLLAASALEWQGQRVPLRSLRLVNDMPTGRDNRDTAMAVGAAAGVAGFLVRGGNIDVPAGATAVARVAADVRLVTGPAIGPATIGAPDADPPLAPADPEEKP